MVFAAFDWWVIALLSIAAKPPTNRIYHDRHDQSPEID